MGQKLKPLGNVTVTTAGSRVRLTTSDIPATSIAIVADPLNTLNVYVGDSTVSASTGFPLAPGDVMPLSADRTRGYSEEMMLSDIYVDADTNGNKVRVFYLGRR